VVARGVAVQADGSIVVAGTVSGQVTFGSGTPYQTVLAGGQLGSVLVAKFAADGSFRSGRLFSSPSADGIAVRALPDGSSIVAGQFQGQIILDNGLPTQTTLMAVGGANDYDAFLAHVGADGNLIWVAQIGGPNYDFPTALDVATDGSAALAGLFSSSITFNAGQASAITLTRPSSNFQENWLARFDANGKAIWARASGGTSTQDQIRGTAVLTDGSVAISGEFDGNTSFEGQTPPLSLTSTAMTSFFVAHYQSNGGLDWARTTNAASTGYHVRQGASGSLVVTGLADATAVFGAGEPTQVTFGGAGGNFVARYQEGGGFLGIGRLGSSLTENDMLVDPSGGVEVVGTFYYMGTFATAGMDTTVMSLGWEDAYTACATLSGQVAWWSRAGGNQHDYAYAAARAAGGDLVVVGSYTADLAVNPGLPGAINLPVGMGAFENAFLARYTP
jgi:hypothetical protein